MRRWTLAFFLAGLLAAGSPTLAQAAVIVTPIGSPAFVPTDFHLFAAPLGTAATGYTEVVQTAQTILPSPNHDPNLVLGIGPGTPHAGPYGQEIGQGVAVSGFVESAVFTTTQYSNGTGVYLAFMLVPGSGSTVGSSPDFASGPILPNALFPLTLDARTFTDEAQNDILGQLQIPAIDQVPGFQGLAGHSHVPIFLVDNFDFADRPVAGSYEYRISILDAGGNGYLLTAPFQVQAVPEPPAWTVFGLAWIAVWGLAFRAQRRRRHRDRRCAGAPCHPALAVP